MTINKDSKQSVWAKRFGLQIVGIFAHHWSWFWLYLLPFFHHFFCLNECLVFVISWIISVFVIHAVLSNSFPSLVKDFVIRTIWFRYTVYLDAGKLTAWKNSMNEYDIPLFLNQLEVSYFSMPWGSSYALAQSSF